MKRVLVLATSASCFVIGPACTTAASVPNATSTPQSAAPGNFFSTSAPTGVAPTVLTRSGPGWSLQSRMCLGMESRLEDPTRGMGASTALDDFITQPPRRVRLARDAQLCVSQRPSCLRCGPSREVCAGSDIESVEAAR